MSAHYAPAQLTTSDPGPSQYRAITDNYFFLVTATLALTAWFVSLISQAIVTNNIGNGPIGVLWFAILVQAFLILRTLYAFATPSTSSLHPQITAFGCIAIVFAAIGVDRNVFSSTKSQHAVAAGWLITAVVDILWVGYFTSEPGSLAHRTVARLGPRGDAPPTRNPLTGGYERSSSRGMSPQVHSPAGESVKGRSAFDATTQNRDSGIESQVRPIQAVPMGSLGRRSSAFDAINSRPESYPYRAEAVFQYAGSVDDPNELAFAKGEILEIADKSGNWWEARKADGVTGIAPSNYLRPL